MFDLTIVYFLRPSSLLGLQAGGGEDVRRGRGSGAPLHRSPHWLKLFQLLQLALPQHPAAPAASGVPRATLAHPPAGQDLSTDQQPSCLRGAAAQRYAGISSSTRRLHVVVVSYRQGMLPKCGHIAEPPWCFFFFTYIFIAKFTLTVQSLK